MQSFDTIFYMVYYNTIFTGGWMNHREFRLFEPQRERMIKRDLQGRGISDANVLKAFSLVPREVFVPAHMRPLAYNDSPLPIGKGQTISQPYIIARMLEFADLKKEQKVLEIGTGSGYQTALLCHCVNVVYTMERITEFVKKARDAMDSIGVHKPHMITGDGSMGYPEKAPYDRIIVSAGAPEIPGHLVDQLADDGVMILPVGEKNAQQLVKVMKKNGAVKKESLDYCIFVPLIGEDGWKEE